MLYLIQKSRDIFFCHLKILKIGYIDRILIIQYFGDAADLCMRAGMDMILIHGGHGMFISQFLSPHANKRTDHYGGSVENRSRFVYELLSAIRERVGNKVAIEYRLSAEELTPDGTRLADTGSTSAAAEKPRCSTGGTTSYNPDLTSKNTSENSTY